MYSGGAATETSRKKLRERLRIATREHRHLREREEELARRFADVMGKSKILRARVEERLASAFAELAVASAVMSPEVLEQSLIYPKQSVELDITYKDILGVGVPAYDFDGIGYDSAVMYPYGFARTSGELDTALTELNTVFRDMLELAQEEKTAQLLECEIEKVRQRANALEYVLIPDMLKNIRHIEIKIEEADLG